jgi:pseudouridine kinase
MASPLPIVCIGGALIDRKHRLKGAVVAGSSNPSVAVSGFGGVARNVAELLVRLGAVAHLAAAVGEDAAGRELAAHAAAAGVDTALLQTMSGAPTAEYLAIFAHDTGDLIIGASSMDAAEMRMEGCIGAVLAVLPTHCLVFADANLSAATLRTIASHTRRNGLFLALDAVSVAKAARLPHDLGGVGLVVMNRDEAKAYLGADSATAELARMLRARGAAAAVVTAGAKGASLADADGVEDIPADAAAVVDVTGAGDCLLAAILWRVGLGETPRQALPWGLAAAAATVASTASVPSTLSADFLAAAISRIGRP